MGNRRPLCCDALVVSCIDFRLQAQLDAWLSSVLGYGRYDRVALAGGVKDRGTVLAQVALAARLHGIRLVLLLNHEDCGAYGAEGTPDRHRADLRAIQRRIQAELPDLVVVLGYVQLDGAFIHVPAEEGIPVQSLAAVVRDVLRGPES